MTSSIEDLLAQINAMEFQVQSLSLGLRTLKRQLVESLQDAVTASTATTDTTTMDGKQDAVECKCPPNIRRPLNDPARPGWTVCSRCNKSHQKGE